MQRMADETIKVGKAQVHLIDLTYRYPLDYTKYLVVRTNAVQAGRVMKEKGEQLWIGEPLHREYGPGKAFSTKNAAVKYVVDSYEKWFKKATTP
jgi:hypothetical protein